MMEQNIDINVILFKKIKKQFYDGLLSREEYLHTLTLLYESIDEIESNSTKKDFILRSLGKPETKINHTITIALSLN